MSKEAAMNNRYPAWLKIVQPYICRLREYDPMDWEDVDDTGEIHNDFIDFMLNIAKTAMAVREEHDFTNDEENYRAKCDEGILVSIFLLVATEIPMTIPEYEEMMTVLLGLAQDRKIPIDRLKMHMMAALQQHPSMGRSGPFCVGLGGDITEKVRDAFEGFREMVRSSDAGERLERLHSSPRVSWDDN